MYLHGTGPAFMEPPPPPPKHTLALWYMADIGGGEHPPNFIAVGMAECEHAGAPGLTQHL